MSREEYIQTIQSLYPPDSEYFETQQIGTTIMVEVIRKYMDWKDLPDNILKEMADRCVDLDKNREAIAKANAMETDSFRTGIWS